MLDCLKSTPNHRTIHIVGALALTTDPSASDLGRLSPGAERATQTAEPRYSIRVAENPGAPCAACQQQKTGAGPVGYLDERPICDMCLLEGSSDLGMLLAVVAVNRVYAATGGEHEERQLALEELGAFARIYHHIASKSWPVRIFRIPGFTAQRGTEQ